MHKLNFTIIVLTFVVLFSGCNFKKGATKQIEESTHTGEFEPESAKQVSDTLINELQLNNMIKLDIEDVSIHYGIEPDYLDDFSAYASMAEGCADEIAVFKISSKKKRQVVIDALMEKMKLKSESYKELNVKEYEKFSANSVSIHGDFIVVTVCSSPTTAFQVLDEFYK